MRKLLFIVLLLVSFQSFSQLVQYPTNYGIGYRRIGGDTLLWCPLDTFSVPASLAAKSHLARKGTTLYYWNGSAWAAFAGGSGNTNSNIGSAYRLAVPNTNNIKTLGANYGIILDSATSNQIGVKFDSATAFPQVRSTVTRNIEQVLNDGSTTSTNHKVTIGANKYLEFLGSGSGQAQIGISDANYVGIISSDSTNKTLLYSLYPNTQRSSILAVEPNAIKINPSVGNLLIDTLTYVPGTKALRYNPSTGLVSYADTTTGGSGNYNSNVGSAYRLAIPNTNNIKTLSAKYGITLDSATTNEIGIKADTATLFPAVRATISGVSDSSKFTLQRDTIALASFGAGGGQAGDTTSFSTSTIYGSFYNDGSDTLVITSIRAVLQGSSPSLVPTVYYNDSINVTAGATKLVNSPSALTNTAVGVSSTPDNKKIPPGVWVWVKTETVTTKPTYFSLTLIGYKKRK